ncbi:hypothetical protein [Bradyrhizobium sp. Gha]|uniref:hypothetical protein n=1 Tax=Bradyrhizobium sp. Gha TaxID=1855318 RepID=UPI0008EC2691|nr:hypothetical protein [Bradyrhizobium sp. Gha]SFI77384.1 hypothetical protein SAMN05216525_113134 [Bradyrhizobium sp. Gha]
MMKASGRAAWIVLAGLLLLFGAAVQATPSSATSAKPDKQTDAAKPGKQRHHASHRHTDSKTAQKSDDKANKADATPPADEAKTDKQADNKAANDAPPSNQMPPEVANANAQVAAADTTPAAAASAMTGRVNDNMQAATDSPAAAGAENQVVAADQLNDLDRALQQDNPAAPKAAVAATDAQPRPAPVMASSQPSSAWDQSSLIGKIFIGVGTLLTLASAARMFMA